MNWSTRPSSPYTFETNPNRGSSPCYLPHADAAGQMHGTPVPTLSQQVEERWKTMNTFTVEAPNIGTAWIRAVQKLDHFPERRAYHTVVRISDPLRDDPDTHIGLDRVLNRLDLQPVETVANTIFPADLAARSRDHAHLVDRYLSMYEIIRKLSPNKNGWGTYFGRLVAYPSTDNEHGFDQLGAVISWLQKESAYKGGKTARYETTLAHALD